MRPIPQLATDITPAWLTEALVARHPGVEVTAVEVVEQHRGTNANALLEVSYTGEPGLPERLFVKLLPTDPAEREAINRTGMGVNEVRFYQQLADRISMRTPQVLVAEVDTDGAFVVVLEDLIASGCTLPDADDGVAPAAALGAMDDYAALHHRYLDPAVRSAEADWVKPSRKGSSYGKDRLQFGLDNHRHRLSGPFAELSQFYIDHQAVLHDLWGSGEQTVLQGDSHLGNVFLDPSGPTGDRVGFLDWGLINLGVPMRDVSYFITMTLSPENRRNHERELIQRYLDTRAALGPMPLSFDQAWEAHRIQAAYTVVASCQIVQFPPTWSPERERFALAFLDRSQQAVADLETREALRQETGL